MIQPYRYASTNIWHRLLCEPKPRQAPMFRGARDDKCGIVANVTKYACKSS